MCDVMIYENRCSSNTVIILHYQIYDSYMQIIEM